MSSPGPLAAMGDLLVREGKDGEVEERRGEEGEGTYL